jgi:hypothetical protein
LFAITRNNGSWCPLCSSSNGNAAVLQSLRELLVELLQLGHCNIKEEARFPGCIGSGGRCMPFDIAVSFADGRRLLVEFDGVQHFEYAAFFHRRAKVMARQRLHDMLKTKFAVESGATLLRIAYTDLDSVDDWVRTALCEVAHGALGRVIFSDPRLYVRQSDWARTCPALQRRWAQATIRRCLAPRIDVWRRRFSCAAA